MRGNPEMVAELLSSAVDHLIAVFVYGLIFWNARVSTSDWRQAQKTSSSSAWTSIPSSHGRALEPRPPAPVPVHGRLHRRDAADRRDARPPAGQGGAGEGFFRSIYLFPMAISFIASGSCGAG